MSDDAFLQRLLAAGRPTRPARAARVDEVLAEVGLPAAPTYRRLLELTDAMQVGDLTIYGVKRTAGWRFIGEMAPIAAPVIPVASGPASHLGWDTTAQQWCHTAFGHQLTTYPDDHALLLDAAERFVPGFTATEVPAPSRRDVPPLPDLVAAIPPGWRVPKPRGAGAIAKAAAAFQAEAGIAMPADYRELLSICDGFEVNGLVVYGARQVASEQDDVPAGFTRIGIMDDQALGYSSTVAQWLLVDAGCLEPDSDADRFATFTELVATLLQRRLE